MREATISDGMEEQDGREWIDGEDHYGLRVFERERKRYAFAWDADEARAAAGRYIEDSLFAFRPGFLLSFIEHEEHARGRVERALERMQAELCEDANDLVRALVGARLDALKAAAIEADGLGHFLAFYDGRENEEPDGGLSFRLN